MCLDWASEREMSLWLAGVNEKFCYMRSFTGMSLRNILKLDFSRLRGKRSEDWMLARERTKFGEI